MFLKTVRSGIIMLALTLITAAWAADFQDGIRVTGSSTVYGSPDVAVFSAGFGTSAAEVGEAVARTDEVAAAIATALREAGVAPEDLQTGNFSVYREERTNSEGEQLPPVFHASNSLRVTVRDTERAGELLGVALEAGANQVDSLQFAISDSRELEEKARELALTDARERAEQLAEHAEVTLGSPVAIHELPSSSGTPPVAGRAFAMEAASVTLESGSIQVQVSVEVLYRIDSDTAAGD